MSIHLDGFDDIDELCVNVVRGIAMDGPAKANSGHPGTAMALAPLAHVLFTRVMNHDPSDPEWIDRDRFILSAGHASILLYSMLFLCGYGLKLDDLKNFRNLGSLTPGHPERGHTRGVEVTTGPLGQGFANGVGMGIAERILRERFGPDLVNHNTYVICGDGDLEEGISHEAASLAGHLGLGRLVYIYDDNHITIDGPTEISYTDDKAERFRSYGWDVQNIGECANDFEALSSAIAKAKMNEERPSLVILRSHIGWPSPRFTDTPEAHGDPFPQDEISATKKLLGLPPDQSFWVPDEVIERYRLATSERGASKRQWALRLNERLAADKEMAQAWDSSFSGKPLPGFAKSIPTFEPGEKIATRAALGKCLNATFGYVPGMVSGAADLTKNTGTYLEGESINSVQSPGSHRIAFGIREHAMGAAMTGMALHGGILPVGGTFFVFSDYLKPAIRLAALSGAHVIYSLTHDSVGLGEDGPTHQPIEHLAALRAVPKLRLIRPADANECAEAWRMAVQNPGPHALVLSRQALPVLEEIAERCKEGLPRGAYTVAELGSGATGEILGYSDPPPLVPQKLPDIVLIGTGSELAVAIEAAHMVVADYEPASGHDILVRVVSMPSWDLFEEQPDGYKLAILPKGVPTVAVEAASSFGWAKYADTIVSIDSFGTSAPGNAALEHFGITPTNVAEAAKLLLRNKGML